MGETTSKLQWLLAAAGVLMIAAGVWIVIGRRAPAPAAAAVPSQPGSERVAMYVQHDGPALRLHWNGDAEAIRRVRSGALIIHDGSRQSRLTLSAAELRGGLASYWPESASGVDFKLELDGAVAGELQAPALAVRKSEEDARPSPFYKAPRSKAASRAAVVEEPDTEMPKPHTVRASDAAPREEVSPRHHADREAADREEARPKPSKWHKVTGKIPLLRRLGRH